MDHIGQVKKQLNQMDEIEFDSVVDRREMRRNMLITAAVEAADEILCEFAEEAELDYLTHEVALRFVEKAAIAHRRALSAHDVITQE